MKKHFGRSLQFVAALAVMFSAASATYAAETWRLLATAVPDECFYGVGDVNNQYPLAGTCNVGRLKTNEAYVWGLTKSGDNIFFGTGQNIHCLVIRGYLGGTDPVLTDDYVCEMGQGPNNPATGAFGDSRPPGLYLYTERGGLVSLLGRLSPTAKQLRLYTLGIRSGGSHQGVAFLAGPGISGGINLFAFDAVTGAFLKAAPLPAYSNVRKWLVASDGRLYLGVGRSESSGGGTVLRWVGNKSNPIAFEEVGIGLDGDAAELAEHEGRLFVSSWPTTWSGERSVRGGGLWMSPPLAQVGTASKGNWGRIWSAADYDPDPVTAATYGGGALKSYNGFLYWGTMHVPGLSLVAHQMVYGQSPSDGEQMAEVLGTWRALSVFRGRNFGSSRQKIELLYGGSTLATIPAGYYQAYLCPGGAPTCDPSSRTWQTMPNKMGLAPLYGRSGFGNAYNNYCWAMDSWNGRLYVGTMDHSYLIYGSGGEIPWYVTAFLGQPEFGADLYRFDSLASPARAISLDGMGNPMNYGIRTMLPDSSALYVGTANPMNLNPDGGWELIKVTEPRLR
jgi:hypothetical protein